MADDFDVLSKELIAGDKKQDKPKDRKAGRLGRPWTTKNSKDLVFDWATDARQYSRRISQPAGRKRLNITRASCLTSISTRQGGSPQAVSSEVRDTVLGMMPDLLRIFFLRDGAVEFRPVAHTGRPGEFAKNKAYAMQATAYFRDVVLRIDNPDFFTTCYDVFQDALVRKTGFIRWGWEKTSKAVYSTHTGLSEEQALALAADDEVEIVSKRGYTEDIPPLGPQPAYGLTAIPPPPPPQPPAPPPGAPPGAGGPPGMSPGPPAGPAGAMPPPGPPPMAPPPGGAMGGLLPGLVAAPGRMLAPAGTPPRFL